MYSVYPHHNTFLRGCERKVNVSAFSTKFERFHRPVDKVGNVCLAAVQMHLFFVYLAFVKYLVY